jgi:aspartyl/asparaginyl beta-hydroxylase (cupin superfamily)
MNTTAYVWPDGEELVFVRPPVEEYHGKLDYFYDPKLFPELQPFQENWKEIQEEIRAYESKNGDLVDFGIMSPPDVTKGHWTFIYLVSFLRKNHKNRSHFPFISSLLDANPNIVLGAISVLNPRTEIAPHYGDTNGIIRAHLALVVPEPYPKIGIKVGDEEMGWEEGKMICFINVQKHQVWNYSDRRRYVLMVDFVPKPLQSRTREICAKGLGSQSFIYVYKTIPFVKHLPAFVHQFMVHVATAIWWVYLPVQRSLKFLK